MNCHRCQGLMYPVGPLDPLDTDGHKLICAWRCVACGDLVDPVIIHNRMRSRNQRKTRQRSTPRHPIFKASVS